MKIYYSLSEGDYKETMLDLGHLVSKLSQEYKHMVVLVDTKEDKEWLTGFFYPFFDMQKFSILEVGSSKQIGTPDCLVVARKNRHEEAYQQYFVFLDCDIFDFAKDTERDDFHERKKKYKELYDLEPEYFDPNRPTPKKKEVVTPPSLEKQLTF